MGAVVAVTVGSAVAFKGEGPGGSTQGPAADPSRDELAAARGEPCPDVLPRTRGSEGAGFGTSRPAQRAPVVPTVERAWVCRYGAEPGVPGPDADGDYVRWVRAGSAVGLDLDQLAAVTARLATLAPQAVSECVSDLGPRWLLVTAAAGDLTGYAVDDFGCRTVRMTDDPAVNEPGVAEQPGTVAGALESDTVLVQLLEGAFESTPDAPIGALLDPLTYTLELDPPRPDGRIASRLTIANDSGAIVTDPGCRVASNYSWGLVPAGAPGAGLPGRVVTKCSGPRDLAPGYSDTARGPVFDPADLPPGEYLATVDFGDARSERLVAGVLVV